LGLLNHIQDADTVDSLCSGGVEVVLPLELQIPSLRITIQEGLTEDKNHKLRLAELEALDEKRLQAQ